MNGQKFHIYECNNCVVTFAVEAAFEDQSLINCPVCQSDEAIDDFAYGEMKIVLIKGSEDY